MRIGIEAQRIFRKNKHGMDYVVLEEIRVHLVTTDVWRIPRMCTFWK